MIITRVLLRPLKKTAQLKRFKASNCVSCGFTDNAFTITFQISDDLEEEVMQDLVINFSNVRIPKVFISKPYTYNNAGSEV